MSHFWQTKSLAELTAQEWEALCDGCGKCCLHKLVDDQNAEEATTVDAVSEQDVVHFTSVACRYLHAKSCQCQVYEQRLQYVPECIKLSPERLDQVRFMPPSCAYRRLHEGRGLAHWHPLLNKGKASKMHQLGMSVRGKIVFDDMLDVEQFEDFIALWPLEDID